MRFVLNEDQNMLRESAADFFAGRLPLAHQRKLKAQGLTHDADAWREMAELGWNAIALPEAVGGVPFDRSGVALVLAEAARTLAATPLFASNLLAAGLIEAAGSDAQKRDWLPALAAGDKLGALALDERARHDPTRIATRATREADGWRINGAKCAVVDGEFADLLLVVARDADTQDTLLFVLDAHTAGVSCQPLSQIDAQPMARVRLDGVKADEAALLARGAAADAALNTVLERARIALAAQLQAISRVLFDTTLAYLKQREQYGRKIGAFQALQHRMARLFTRIELAESCVQAAVAALDTDADLALPAALAKGMAGETALAVADEAVQLHGGIGVTDELDVGLFLKRVQVLEALLGDSVYQRARYARLIGVVA
ncbi:acyl-CoA dehydrogenase family protein [Crenobacter caeni]|uniref:Acyl-CoA/acyl-ACP dehydrogenase n=1 Tax=Crenobacter caeni TaxID=2705474 RepID=A0A6B2KR34_9NEIS|nr:acyl-CoA dehydrogenase family protein [Crenobacter caeni]NDV12696.1 acyl-CoA/acyl-ACP dehydrogenase [Crenobacter caeni]